MKKYWILLTVICMLLTGCSFGKEKYILSADLTQEDRKPQMQSDPTVQETEAPTETEATTEPEASTQTQPVEAGETEISKTDILPYILPVANPHKKIYDKPNGTYLESFDRVGYYVVVEQMEDQWGYTWGKLSQNRGWTLVYQEILPEMDMLFCSGVGAWGNTISIQGTGFFSGLYHDSDMGNMDEDIYPHGTVYLCDYKGKFAVQGITPYTVSLYLSDLKQSGVTGEISYSDGFRYIVGSAYGLEDCEEFILYLPGTPKSMLPQELISWIHGAADSGVLECYVLYNFTNGEAFVSQ